MRRWNRIVCRGGFAALACLGLTVAVRGEGVDYRSSKPSTASRGRFTVSVAASTSINLRSTLSSLSAQRLQITQSKSGRPRRRKHEWPCSQLRS